MDLARTSCALFKPLMGCLLAIATLETRAYAHAGHAALPTKGTQVDLKQGTVFLTREARDALAVKTAEAELEPVEKSILAYAALESPWTKHAFATSRVGGRIERLFVKPGQVVKAGQPLAEVRSLDLENLQLELLNAQNALNLSEKVFKQQQDLARDQIIAGQEFLETTAKHAANESAVKVARLKLQGLGWSNVEIDRFIHEVAAVKSRPLTIASPISGTVTHADLTIGKVVEPNEHLFEIVDLSSVWVRLDILEKDIQSVVLGQAVELKLTAFPNETFAFRVDAKSLALAANSHLGTAWGTLSNPTNSEPKFLPGMYGQARIVVYAPGKKTAVPPSAVVGEGAERFVFVEEEATEKGTLFRKRNVVIDAVTPEKVFLSNGNVFPGDRALTQGAQILASYFAAGVLHPSEEATENIGLRFEPVRSRPIEDTIELDGTVDVPPEQRATVSSQLAGTLDKILVDRGQMVHAGDVVAELNSAEFQNLELELLQADQQVRLLGQQRKLLEGLGERKDGVVSRNRLWELETSHAAASDRRGTARRKLAAVGLHEDQIDAVLANQQPLPTLPLRAPISGALVHFDKALGQAIKAEEPLFEIHDLSRVWVQGNLSERQLSAVRLDPANPQPARVRLTVDPVAVATGKVVRSARVLGNESRSLAIWIELDHPPTTTWQHNMLANITLASGRASTVLAVPRAALAREGLRTFVFVQRQDGMLERRAVETGREDDRFVEIRSGLKEADMIAVSAASDLQTAYLTLR